MTAASRRSLGSVSVPVRRVMLSHPLSVVALVSHYLTNKLMDHRPFPIWFLAVPLLRHPRASETIGN